MCRLIAYVGEPISPRHLVFDGSHSLYEQSWAPSELLSGSVNADGYGVVWYAEGRPARVAETRPIWHDTDLAGTLEAIRSPCVVAALRNSTPGIPVDRSGLLPLLFERWSFVLNGFVPDFRRSHMRALRAALPDELYAELRGPSDSETLFLLAVAALREGATLAEALERVARAVHERVGKEEAQLNMVLGDGERIVAVVGAGHVDGIRRTLLEGREADIAAINIVPPTSPIWKAIGWGVPALIVSETNPNSSPSHAKSRGQEPRSRSLSSTRRTVLVLIS